MSRLLRRNAVSVLLLLVILVCSGRSYSDGSSRPNSTNAVYPIKEGVVDVGGLFLYYTEIGVGEPLVVLHGGPGGSHGYFLPYLLPLARTNRLIFMNERGSGRSGKLQDPSGYTVDNMATDVESLRLALRLGKINLLGHSFGGVLAQSYALKYPKNVSHMILSSTFASTAELNNVLSELKAKIDPQPLHRIEDLEKAGLFGKGQAWEHGRYPSEYLQLVGAYAYYEWASVCWVAIRLRRGLEPTSGFGI